MRMIILLANTRERCIFNNHSFSLGFYYRMQPGTRARAYPVCRVAIGVPWVNPACSPGQDLTLKTSPWLA